jgi:hypothetical protein
MEEVAPSRAQETPDLPAASSLISIGCFVAVGGDPEASTMGPLPKGLGDDCDASFVGDEGAMSTRASIRTDIGPGAPQVGLVHADAHAAHSLPGASNSLATATVGGFANIHLALHQKRLRPGNPPAVIPIVFHAAGEGSVSGDNAYSRGAGDVAAGISGFELPADVFGLQLDSSTAKQHGGFDSAITLDLEPWTPENPKTYLIGVEAHCTASAVVQAIAHQDSSPTYVPGNAACQVKVDPSVIFDQSAFDKRMSGASYPLADYYEIVFSENVPPGDAGPGNIEPGSDPEPDAGAEKMDAGTSDHAGDHSGDGCSATGGTQSDGVVLVNLAIGLVFALRALPLRGRSGRNA